MNITMKSSYGAPANWAAELVKNGIEVTEKPTFFGRTLHLFKLHGEVVHLLQDPQQAVKSAVATLTRTQKRIIDALMASGVVVDAPESSEIVKKTVQGRIF